MEFIAEFILDFIGDIAEILLDKHLKTKAAKLLFTSFMLLGFLALAMILFLKKS